MKTNMVLKCILILELLSTVLTDLRLLFSVHAFNVFLQVALDSPYLIVFIAVIVPTFVDDTLLQSRHMKPFPPSNWATRLAAKSIQQN